MRLGRRSGSRSRPRAGTSATKRPRTGLPKSRSRRPGRRPRRGCWSAGTQPSAATYRRTNPASFGRWSTSAGTQPSAATYRADAAGPAHAPRELGRAFGPQPAGRRIFSSNRRWSFRCLQTRSEHDQSGLLQRTRRSTSPRSLDRTWDVTDLPRSAYRDRFRRGGRRPRAHRVEASDSTEIGNGARIGARCNLEGAEHLRIKADATLKQGSSQWDPCRSARAPWSTRTCSSARLLPGEHRPWREPGGGPHRPEHDDRAEACSWGRTCRWAQAGRSGQAQ